MKAVPSSHKTIVRIKWKALLESVWYFADIKNFKIYKFKIYKKYTKDTKCNDKNILKWKHT